MHWGYLLTFLTVAEVGSISGAAEILHLTQPAVSKQIQQVEARFGVRLFERTGRNVELTPGGRVLVNYARQVQHLLEQAEQELAELNGTLQGRLTVGASTVPGQYVMPRIIRAFRESYPEVQVRMWVGDTQEVAEKLLAGGVELALVGAPLHHARVEGWQFAADRLVLIVPADHPLAAKTSITLQDVLPYHVVWRERGSGTRQVIEEKLREAGVDPGQLRITLELGTTEAVVNAVEAGLGISFVSAWAVQKHLRLGTLASPEVEGLALARGLYIYYLVAWRQRRVLQAFLQTLRQFDFTVPA